MTSGKAPLWVGSVSKESRGILWPKGSIWEINCEPHFLCNDCSKKAVEEFESNIQEIHKRPSGEELEKIDEQASSDKINPLQVPEKYINELYFEEDDWTYRLRVGAKLTCGRCKRTVNWK